MASVYTPLRLMGALDGAEWSVALWECEFDWNGNRPHNASLWVQKSLVFRCACKLRTADTHQGPNTVVKVAEFQRKAATTRIYQLANPWLTKNCHAHIRSSRVSTATIRLDTQNSLNNVYAVFYDPIFEQFQSVLQCRLRASVKQQRRK
jgi:hypothetical protein